MTGEERLSVFLDSLSPAVPEYLAKFEKEARENGVPIIRKEAQRLLRVLLAEKRPETILEIGTAVGYSAVFMKEYAPSLKELITIENYEPRIKEARDRIQSADPEGVIELREGDAEEVIKTLPSDRFDFVFLDAAKGQYPVLLPEIHRVMKKGAMLLTDNVLFQDGVLESRFVVTRRDRTIHKRMREYLSALMDDVYFRSTVLEVADGVAISVKL